jgi:hypothetical protein
VLLSKISGWVVAQPAHPLDPPLPVREKLSWGNHVLWKAQVLATLRGAQLAGFLDEMNKASAEKIFIKSQKDSEKETRGYRILSSPYRRLKNNKF